MTTPPSHRGRSLTEGRIGPALLLFALPTLGSNILQTLNGSINAVWVGQFLGKTGLAATSNGNLLMFMVYALVFGFGTAATIMVGQTRGRGDIDGLRRAVGAGAGLFLVMGAVAALAGWIAAPALLRLLGTPADVYPAALAYLRLMFVGVPPGLVMLSLSMALRGTGDSVTPLLFMLPGLVVDVTFNPILILGLGPAPRMGIAGAATATVIGNYVSLLALLAHVYRRDLVIRLRGAELAYLWPSRGLLAVILGKGLPMGLQMIVMSGSGLVMMGLVNLQGTLTVAAYGAANQLWTYTQLPASAIGMAVSAMAAQNIGAGRWDRIGAITRAGIAINLAVTGGAVLAIRLLDAPLLSLFLGHDAAAIETARHINLLAGWNFVLAGVMMILTSVVRANGATLAPLVIIAIAYIPGRLGAAIGLQPLLGVDAIWWSFPIGAALSLVLTASYYRQGGWRRASLAPLPAIEAEELVQGEAQPTTRSHPAI